MNMLGVEILANRRVMDLQLQVSSALASRLLEARDGVTNAAVQFEPGSIKVRAGPTERLGLWSCLDWFQTRAISVELADFRWEGERLAFDVRQPLPLGVVPRGPCALAVCSGAGLGASIQRLVAPAS